MRSGYWPTLAGICAANVLVLSPLSTFLGFMMVPQAISNEAFSSVFHLSGLAAAFIAGLVVGLISWQILLRFIPAKHPSGRLVLVISLAVQSTLAAVAWNLLSVGLFVFSAPIICGAVLLLAASIVSPLLASVWLERRVPRLNSHAA